MGEFFPRTFRVVQPAQALQEGFFLRHILHIAFHAVASVDKL